MKSFLKKSVAVLGTAAVVVGGSVLTASAAAADGPDGEVTGHNWPGTVGTNFEGTYRMPDGTEAWCATIWAPAPLQNDGSVYSSTPTLLLKTDNTELTQEQYRRLAYIIAESSDKVIGADLEDPEVRAYAAATAVIIHDWTNAGGASVYNPSWPIDHFASGVDAADGSNTSLVKPTYEKLLADSLEYGGSWTLDLDPVDFSGATVGDVVTVRGSLLRTVDDKPIADTDVHVFATGATVPTSVLTDASGEFSFDATLTATSGTIGVDRITPADTVQMRVPTAWTGDKPQNMVLVSDNTTVAELPFTAQEPAVPTLGTSATDQADGDKVLPYDGGTITDVVAYTGLTPGVEYEISGVIYNKTDDELTNITATKTFTPTEANGTVDVEFVVPAGFAGKTLVVFEYLTLNGEPVAEHEDPNDPEQTVTVGEEPTLKTSASDQADGDKVLPFNGGTITDVVAYTGLTPGVAYEVSGVIYNRTDDELTTITATKTFTPTAADGTVEVEFAVPSGYAGKTLVVFEYLTLDGKPVAEHEDPNDEEQTVTVNPAPTLKTSATDQKDGDRVLPAEGGTIVDVVTFTGLTPGQTYTVKGELIDKATGAATGIKAEMAFKPTTADGTVRVTFTVPKGYAGKTLVVFEKLYDASGALVAEHTDINDAAQTVKVETPGLPPTGADTSMMVLLAGGAVLAVAIGVLLVARGRRKDTVN